MLSRVEQVLGVGEKATIVERKIANLKGGSWPVRWVGVGDVGGDEGGGAVGGGFGFVLGMAAATVASSSWSSEVVTVPLLLLLLLPVSEVVVEENLIGGSLEDGNVASNAPASLSRYVNANEPPWLKPRIPSKGPSVSMKASIYSRLEVVAEGPKERLYVRVGVVVGGRPLAGGHSYSPSRKMNS